MAKKLVTSKVAFCTYGCIYAVVIALVAAGLHAVAPGLSSEWQFIAGMAIGIPVFLLLVTHPLVSRVQAC